MDFMERNYPPGFTYGDFAPMFTAEFFNASKWAGIFKVSLWLRSVVVVQRLQCEIVITKGLQIELSN